MAKLEENEPTETIWVSVGITKNLGNYESLRIDAGARYVVDPDGEKTDLWKRAWDEVQDQLEAQIVEADNSLNE